MDMRMNRMLSVKACGIHRASSSVAKGFEAAGDRRLGTSESRRSTMGGNFRILLDSVKDGGVFHCLGELQPRFVFAVRVSLCEPSVQAVDGVDGSGILLSAR